MAHYHHYHTHPNPEWTETHVACTICGMAAPLYLAAIGVREAATCSPEVAQRMTDSYADRGAGAKADLAYALERRTVERKVPT
jgi:hypothetical protein